MKRIYLSRTVVVELQDDEIPAKHQNNPVYLRNAALHELQKLLTRIEQNRRTIIEAPAAPLPSECAEVENNV
jgi:hypothetical protein